MLANRHEKAEMNGLVSHSFGREEANRFTFVFKKDHAPTQSQLKAIEFVRVPRDESANILLEGFSGGNDFV